MGGSCEGEYIVMGFVDSYFAGSLDTRESQTGYVFSVFGSAVSWKLILRLWKLLRRLSG